MDIKKKKTVVIVYFKECKFKHYVMKLLIFNMKKPYFESLLLVFLIIPDLTVKLNTNINENDK